MLMPRSFLSHPHRTVRQHLLQLWIRLPWCPLLNKCSIRLPHLLLFSRPLSRATCRWQVKSLTHTHLHNPCSQHPCKLTIQSLRPLLLRLHLCRSLLRLLSLLLPYSLLHLLRYRYKNPQWSWNPCQLQLQFQNRLPLPLLF